ncbi:Imidazoleglycerol-phosphate dehydratase [Sedimentisphaera cyanobacteriorum]|uniref:Imidazoleglycerol-phosphate dehydratase n=1 Tax=Sedimentisphaera cyanobacteriorum TaxID=1940790 RepID=A0A1Q2HLH3_9BACT|nr:imidazoleglycerol-phosphate dehydratase HisB [Sedimentisphaera cyanobacteriorum]AQQ08419.1 Imidazoleglycerol-phosphate dehydratase [Sedimentisphaera cyanobacteriorum]
MSDRKAEINRKTTETQVNLSLNLDGKGICKSNTGIGFLDHMLAHLSKHSGIDITIQASGDYEVDYHHTCEDAAICLGTAFNEALGDKRGINRYGWASVPMEDALANASVDISGRPYLAYNIQFTSSKIGSFDVELLEEFLRSFTNSARINMHINVPYGTNNHHIAESVFKALGQAFAKAVEVTGDEIPSTKGVL